VEHLSGKKRCLAFGTNISGEIKVNDGAQKALLDKNASLLPAGIIEVKSKFNMGDVVSIVDSEGVEIAKGMVNYSAAECKKVMGLHSDELEQVLGHKNYDAIITRDNIVLL
jgi:glutamate 5-kinase